MSNRKTLEEMAREQRNQQKIADIPAPAVPDTPLKPKRSQTEKPTLLEMYQEEIKQGKLF